MKMSKKELGKWGENKAKEFLIKRNYKIINQNYYTRRGEIDLIALKQKFLIFIEVKTRTSKSFGLPQTAVDLQKRTKIKQVANYFLLNNDYRHYKIRFDVIAIYIKDKKASLKHFRNAF